MRVIHTVKLVRKLVFVFGLHEGSCGLWPQESIDTYYTYETKLYMLYIKFVWMCGMYYVDRKHAGLSE